MLHQQPEDWLFRFSAILVPILFLTASHPDTHTHLSMWVMSDNLWSVPQVVQSQTKTHQLRANVCLSSSTLILFSYLSIGFQPLSLPSVTIACLSFSCLTCFLSTLCSLDFIHVKLLQCPSLSPISSSTPYSFHHSYLLCVCDAKSHTFCVCVMPNHTTSSQHTPGLWTQ